jgi:hypothetical protein
MTINSRSVGRPRSRRFASTRGYRRLANSPNRLVSHFHRQFRSSTSTMQNSLQILANHLCLQRHTILKRATIPQVIKVFKILLHPVLGKTYPFPGDV